MLRRVVHVVDHADLPARVAVAHAQAQTVRGFDLRTQIVRHLARVRERPREHVSPNEGVGVVGGMLPLTERDGLPIGHRVENFRVPCDVEGDKLHERPRECGGGDLTRQRCPPCEDLRVELLLQCRACHSLASLFPSHRHAQQ